MKRDTKQTKNNETNKNPNLFRLFRYFSFVSCLSGFLVVTSYAHPAPFSYLDLRLNRGQQRQIEAVLVVHVIDVAHDLNVTPPETLLDPIQLESKKDAILSLLRPRLFGHPLSQLGEYISYIICVLGVRRFLEVGFELRCGLPPGLAANVQVIKLFTDVDQIPAAEFDGAKHLFFGAVEIGILFFHQGQAEV